MKDIRTRRLRAFAAAHFLAALPFAIALPMACGTYDFGDAPPDEVEVLATAPTWKSDIKPLMELKCMNCHTQTPSRFAPGNTRQLKLDDEATFKALAPLVEARVFNKPDKPMPPNYGTPLTANEGAALKKYIALLKATVTPTPTQTPTTTPSPGQTPTPPVTLTLSNSYKTNCVVCHGDKGQGGIGKKLAATALSQTNYINKVRAGVPTTSMSAYDAAAISEADLKADHTAFKAAK